MVGLGDHAGLFKLLHHPRSAVVANLQPPLQVADARPPAALHDAGRFGEELVAPALAIAAAVIAGLSLSSIADDALVIVRAGLPAPSRIWCTGKDSASSSSMET